MRAVRYTRPGVGRIATTENPVAGEGQLVLAVGSSGICGTDVHIIRGEYPSSSLPRIIGHEFAGTVVQVGAGVDGFEVGDLVAADPNFYCGVCRWCVKGAYNLCVDWGALGLTADGALAERVAVDARFAVALDDSLDAEAGALIEPLSCVLHGFERGGISPGSELLIFGGGMIGLTSLIVGVSMGVAVTVVEPHAFRRERALALGARAAVAALDNGEFEFVQDATGVPAAIAEGFRHLAPQGTFLQMGVTPPEDAIGYNPYLFVAKEWRVIGSNSLANKYRAAAALMPSVAGQMKQLVTHRFPLGQFDQALAAMGSPEAIKVHIQPGR